MGLIRKALSLVTGGLSGLLFGDDSAKQPAAGRGGAKTPRKAAAKPRPARKRAATARAKPQQARKKQTPAGAGARKRTARRPAAGAARAANGAALAAGPDGTTAELERLVRMRGQGALTDAEFAAAKAKILGTAGPRQPAPSPPPFQAIEANVAAARHLADMAERERGEPLRAHGGE